jgi:hypothetical protein
MEAKSYRRSGQLLSERSHGIQKQQLMTVSLASALLSIKEGFESDFMSYELFFIVTDY